MTHSTFKFAHVNINHNRQTIAYRIDDETNTVTYALAQCSPNDQFCKATGRKIAQGRIIKGGVHASTGIPRSFTVPLSKINGGSTKYRDIMAYIHSDI